MHYAQAKHCWRTRRPALRWSAPRGQSLCRRCLRTENKECTQLAESNYCKVKLYLPYPRVLAREKGSYIQYNERQRQKKRRRFEGTHANTHTHSTLDAFPFFSSSPQLYLLLLPTTKCYEYCGSYIY